VVPGLGDDTIKLHYNKARDFFRGAINAGGKEPACRNDVWQWQFSLASILWALSPDPQLTQAERAAYLQEARRNLPDAKAIAPQDQRQKINDLLEKLDRK